MRFEFLLYYDRGGGSFLDKTEKIFYDFKCERLCKACSWTNQVKMDSMVLDHQHFIKNILPFIFQSTNCFKYHNPCYFLPPPYHPNNFQCLPIQSQHRVPNYLLNPYIITKNIIIILSFPPRLIQSLSPVILHHHAFSFRLLIGNCTMNYLLFHYIMENCRECFFNV